MKKIMIKSWFPALLGVILGVILLATALFYLLGDMIQKPVYTLLGENAFGKLSLNQSVNNKVLSSHVESSSSGAGVYPIVKSEDELLLSSEYPPPQIEAYEYLFESTLPDLATIDSTVYRRVSTFSFPSSIESDISQLTLGILPLSSFNNLEIQNISLREQDGDGYNVYLDRTNGNISISRNDGYWLSLADRTPDSQPVVPSNDALIDSASRFLSELQIDTSAYGTAYVDRSFLDLDVWVPESLTVTYPYLIEEKQVWSMWGQPTGMSVSINLRTGEADNLYALGPASFEASDYELASDPEEILGVAKRGGLWEYAPEKADITYTFKLGEPDIILAEHYQYDDKGSSLLYIPALRFPVVEGDPDAPYQRPWIIVPLVQDILDQAQPTPILYDAEPLQKIEVTK